MIYYIQANINNINLAIHIFNWTGGYSYVVLDEIVTAATIIIVIKYKYWKKSTVQPKNTSSADDLVLVREPKPLCH